MKLAQRFFNNSVRLTLVAAFCMLGGLVSAQLDSVNVDIHFEVDQDPMDTTQTIDAMHVDAEIFDVDFMGEVITTVYDAASNYPLAMIKMTKQEFIDEGLKNGDVVTTIFYGLDPADSFQIVTEVRNFQGATFPMITTDYN